MNQQLQISETIKNANEPELTLIATNKHILVKMEWGHAYIPWNWIEEAARKLTDATNSQIKP